MNARLKLYCAVLLLSGAFVGGGFTARACVRTQPDCT